MEEKFINATTKRPEGERTTDAAMVTIDVNSFIELIKKEKSWEEGDRNAITVFKTNGMRIVLIALRKGAKMKKHKADGLICLQVLEGQIKFKTDEQTVKLGKGQMLTLHEAILHDVLAKEEAIFLLTLTTTLEGKSN
jgi:quercetin dioxygenase-like cupin family protein